MCTWDKALTWGPSCCGVSGKGLSLASLQMLLAHSSPHLTSVLSTLSILFEAPQNSFTAQKVSGWRVLYLPHTLHNCLFSKHWKLEELRRELR